MTDRPTAGHPRTQRDMLDLTMRSAERARSQLGRQPERRTEVRFGTVVEVGAYGCFKIDQFTDDEGNGQWFSALNNWTPGVGDGVAYTYMNGSPIAIGPITAANGKWRIIPDPTANGYNEPAFAPLLNHRGRPFIEVDADEWFVRFGAPPIWDPNCLWWHSHFNTITGNHQIWTSGGGSQGLHAASPHALQLITGTSSGNFYGITQRMTTVGQGAIQARDNWEFMALIGWPSQTSYVVRAGLMSEITLANSNGFYVVFDQSGAGWGVQQSGAGGVDAFPGIDPGGGPWLVRIRSRRDPENLDDSDARLITYQLLGGNTPDANGNYAFIERDIGDFKVLAEHVESVFVESALFDPAISIATTASGAKKVHIDYWGGWSYVEQAAVGLTSA